MIAALAALAVVAIGIAAAVWYASDQIVRRRRPDRTANPAEYGLEYEEVTFTSEDGIPLRGWLIPAQEARRAVIFLHGHAGSMDPDLKYAPWFHERGISVLMFDFRGHGRSGGRYVSMGYFERRDLLAAERFLLGRGYTRIGVLGFSMGGAVAISGAPLSQNIRAVAADGSFVWLRDAIYEGMRERGIPGAPAKCLAFLAVKLADWRLGADLEEADPGLWASKVAPRALLLIHGEQDPYTSTEEVRAMFASAGAPKELWVVPGAGHRNVDEVEPEAYKQKVLEFFERYLGEE
ncbi:MAG: alpha/beta fold hydrolase [Chloroflexi bacterium]|nr:alpha/beta fold hydrolase [Chloroflexota bacterium]